MTITTLRNGSQIAQDLPTFSNTDQNPNTLGDLMDRLQQQPPKTFPMLRTTCSILVAYQGKPADQISLDSVFSAKDGLRPFLESRKYSENSIRSYVNYVRILLNAAKEWGWQPDSSMPDAWHPLIQAGKARYCADVFRYVARQGKLPSNVTVADLDQWEAARLQLGLSLNDTKSKKRWFWRLLRDGGYAKNIPPSLMRERNFGFSMKRLPADLKDQVEEILRWKQAAYEPDRPKDGRHRAITAEALRRTVCRVLAFAVNVRGETGITSLSQLAQKPILRHFSEWCINIRQIKGRTVQGYLHLFPSCLRRHPSYSSLDFDWLNPLLDSIPVEPESEVRMRKAAKYLEYRVIEAIPAKIHAERPIAAKQGIEHLSRSAMEELLMKWLIILVWRQRNIRECRVNGPTPNLYKAKIPPFAQIDKPDWAQREEQLNPEAEFWQFHFSRDETKTGKDVHALLPRPLIAPLEEYLRDYRPHLIQGVDPETLFLNRKGKPLSIDQVTDLTYELTQRHGGRRVNPHSFRDVVAFTWLKEYPKDYLTLSKILWHANINMTIRIYGSRFNESSGVCAMESWLEEREAKSK